MNQDRSAGQSVGSTLTGQTKSGAGCEAFHPQSITNAHACKAPLATIPARIEGDGLIFIGSQHVARVVGQELQRTLDLGKETLRGAILFRCDVLQVARQAGARVAVCKDRASGDVYRAALDTFDLRGWVFNHSKFGLQKGLALAHWQRNPAVEPAVRQLGLWGVS